jgi:hypothetical protein
MRPSGTLTSLSPNQDTSTTVPSKPAHCSAPARPFWLALAWKATSQSPGALSGAAKATPSAFATAARLSTGSTSVTSAPGSRPQSAAMRQPTTPPPKMAMRSPGPAPESQSAFSAVSMLAASTARRGGTPSGTRVSAEAGATMRSWCGCRMKTVRPRSSAGPSSTTPTAR